MSLSAGKPFLIFSSVVILLLLISGATTHFLSVEDLEEFYDLEEKLVATFTSYLEEQKAILDVVKTRYEDQKLRRPLLNDTEEYLSNPLNVHALLKRLVSDWPLTLALLGGQLDDDDDDDEEEEGEEGESIKLPNREEYRASVHSIGRLQQVYNFSIAELVSGSVFEGTDHTSILTADDCLSVARDMYETRHYNLAVDWLKEALAQVTNQSQGGSDLASGSQADKPSDTFPPIQNILEYLALSTCFTGDHKKSRKYFNKLYNNYPDFRPTQGLIRDHLLAVNDSCRKLIDNKSLKPKVHSLNVTWQEDAELSVEFGQLCRTLNHSQKQPLSCHLAHYGIQYLLLQPLQIEVLNNDPYVFLLHNAIHPDETNFLLKTMEKSPYEMKGFVYEFWNPLPENASVSEALLRRIEDTTGKKAFNEWDQVVLSSLPVGADYVLQQDADRFDNKRGSHKERIATVMFFLEEPQSGGYIVFPRLGMSIAPVRGAALIWYNLDEDDKVDHKLIYGSCPVLRGHQTLLRMWVGEEDKNKV